MKHNVSLIVGAIALAAAAGSKAQTAVTDPVGYITCKVAAGNSLSFISPTLINKLEFSGVASSATATTITLAGATPLTAGAYLAVFNEAYNPTVGVLMPGYYVEVSSGNGAGQWANITNNTANGLTVDRDLSSFITGASTTVRIRKHVTISEMFGATNSAGLKSGIESVAADEIKVLEPVTHTVKSYFYYSEDGFAQWLSASNKEAQDVIILPDQGIIVQRKAGGGALSFVRVGHVKTGPTAIYATPGLNLLPTPRAVGDTFTLGNSNLANAGAVSGSVLGGIESNAADLLRIPQNDGSLGNFFFYSEDGFTQWFDSFNHDATNEKLNEGESFILIRKASAGPLTWTAPAQPIN